MRVTWPGENGIDLSMTSEFFLSLVVFFFSSRCLSRLRKPARISRPPPFLFLSLVLLCGVAAVPEIKEEWIKEHQSWLHCIEYTLFFCVGYRFVVTRPENRNVCYYFGRFHVTHHRDGFNQIIYAFFSILFFVMQGYQSVPATSVHWPGLLPSQWSTLAARLDFQGYRRVRVFVEAFPAYLDRFGSVFAQPTRK